MVPPPYLIVGRQMAHDLGETHGAIEIHRSFNVRRGQSDLI